MIIYITNNNNISLLKIKTPVLTKDTIKIIPKYVFEKCLFIPALSEPFYRNALMVQSAAVAMSHAQSGVRPKHNVLSHPTTFILVFIGSTTLVTGLKESHSFSVKIILVLSPCLTFIKTFISAK